MLLMSNLELEMVEMVLFHGATKHVLQNEDLLDEMEDDEVI